MKIDTKSKFNINPILYKRKNKLAKWVFIPQKQSVQLIKAIYHIKRMKERDHISHLDICKKKKKTEKLLTTFIPFHD